MGRRNQERAPRPRNDDHDYMACQDEACPRFPCRVFKEGFRAGRWRGRGEGESAGYAKGYAAGHAAGAARAAAAAR